MIRCVPQLIRLKISGLNFEPWRSLLDQRLLQTSDSAPLGLRCGSMRCVVCGVGGWVLCVGDGVLRYDCAATSDIPDASVFQCFL